MRPAAMSSDANGMLTLARCDHGAGTNHRWRVAVGWTGAVVPVSVVRLTSAGDVVLAAAYGCNTANGTTSCVSSFVF
jgi:hypothetical protein